LRALLDTHVLLYWVGESPRLSTPQRQVIESASPKNPLLVSDITLWEIATLQSLKRIAVRADLRSWLEQITAPPLVQRVGISPAVAAEVAALPDAFPRDPGDRVIVASARVLGATLLTQDRTILTASLVPTLS